MAPKPVTWLAAMLQGLQHRSNTSASSATGQAHTHGHVISVSSLSSALGHCEALRPNAAQCWHLAGSLAVDQSNIRDVGGHQVQKILHAAVVHEEERLFNTCCCSRCMCANNYCFQILIAN